MESNHVIVIGAGTVGASCAWHLVQEGARVTLVDRELPGQATSFGNAACISPTQITPYSYPGVWKKLPGWLLDRLGPMTVRWTHLPWVAPWLWKFWRHGTAEGVASGAAAQAALMHRVTADFQEIVDQAGLAQLLVSRGLIQVYENRAHFEAERWSHDIEEQYGFRWEHLGAAELRIMAPALQLGDGMALYLPSWQHVLDPARLTAGLVDAARREGARWLHESVQAIEALPGRVTLTLSGGTKVSADHVVVAAGPWSNQLARQLDHTVPMAPKRGYHAQIAEPGVDLEYPVLSARHLFVMTPLAAGLRIAGTAEFARLDAAPDYRRAHVLVELARRFLPDLQAEGVTEWMGQRPMMADSVPVISRSPRHDNVYYAFGHGHYGLTQGPTTGKIIAALVAAREPGLDMTPYRFERFRRP